MKEPLLSGLGGRGADIASEDETSRGIAGCIVLRGGAKTPRVLAVQDLPRRQNSSEMEVLGLFPESDCADTNVIQVSFSRVFDSIRRLNMIYPSIFLAGLCSFALVSPLQHAHAQVLQGCAAVDCPNRYEDMLSPTCQVVSTDMRLIGLLSTKSELAGAGDLTWTIGDSGLQSTIEGDERTVTRSFYLGTSDTINWTSPDLPFRGCAIFIISPETGAYQVYGQGAPQYDNTASCAGSMGENCVDDLTARVEQLARASSNTNVTAFCEDIALGLQDSPPSSCYILSQQPRIEAVALTGPDAQQPIASSENSTSNCWPTLPKTNELTKIFEYDHIAQLNQTVPWLGYTPLISVFAPVGNDTDTDTGVEVDLACMKIVDSDDFSLGTASNASETNDMKGGAVVLRSNWMAIPLSVSAALIALM